VTVRVNFHFGHLNRMDRCIHGRVEGFCGECWPASGIKTRSAADAERRGPKGESPTVEDGDAQQPNEYPHP
jgi:hypothetical protein